MIEINEQSTGVFDVVFSDEDGVEIDVASLVSCRWQLSDARGNVINGRTFENGLITSMPIVLSGDDLATTGRDRALILAIKIVYNSSHGSNLPATGELKFKVKNLVNIT